MSGGRPFVAPPANGAAACDASACCGAAELSGVRPKRCPATSAMSATSAIAATAHGSAEEKLRSSRCTSEPAGVPQRWQNLAPGASDALQAAHVEAARVAPQFEQNLPDACSPQDGQATRAVASVAEDFGEGEDGVITIKLA